MGQKSEIQSSLLFGDKVAFIGSYLPRQCGIATFTTDLRAAVGLHGDMTRMPVIAMDDKEESYLYPDEVEWTIKQNEPQDYIRAFDYLSRSDCKLLCVQHEYGIYGGDHGAYLLDLLSQLKIPIVVTLHTILKEPTIRQKKILNQLSAVISKFVVMTPLAKKFLTNAYGLPKEQIAIIPHGIPVPIEGDSKYFKAKLNLKGRTILLTFGLLHANKGLETVLTALPDVVKKFPKLAYIILGATHPVIKKREGEAYRIYLRRMVKELGLENNVFFHDQFVALEQLTQYFKATDIYITPYLNEKQITSGTLAYASGCGIPTLSTPYWHAQDLLSNGSGRLFPIKNHEILRSHLLDLLSKPKLIEEMRGHASRQGREMYWPVVGKSYVKLFEEAIAARKVSRRPAKFHTIATELPQISLKHLQRLSDNVGILQHATGIVPNRREGYCIDDNARALLMAMWHFKQTESEESLDLATTYLSYIQYSQKDDGAFHNFMDYQHHFLDSVGSEDSMGRTLWCLGYTVRYCTRDSLRIVAREVFEGSKHIVTQMTHPRSIAFSILGLSHYLKRFPEAREVKESLTSLADKLVAMYKENADANWQWFHGHVTYDNGILPLAMFKAYQNTKNKKYLTIGLNSLTFLQKLCFRNDYLQVVGNENWMKKGDKEPPTYDEQPLDVTAFILAFKEAYHCTKKKTYLDLARNSFAWFTGKNRLSVPLYDFVSHGCCDGLQRDGVNQNQGAESSLCYMIALLTMVDLSHIEPVEEELESSI